MTNMIDLFNPYHITNDVLDTIDFNIIKSWNVSHVTNMWGMFRNAKNFNVDISEWDVSNVNCMRGMFYGAESFNQNLDKWKVNRCSHWTDVEDMFEGTPLEKNPPKWYKERVDKK